jgi:phosphoesterase RecJ-like protein
MALALLAGIYNDTGGFMHSNTTQETFQMASELAAFGVQVDRITRPLFKQSSYNQLRLWGHILENMKKNDTNEI